MKTQRIMKTTKIMNDFISINSQLLIFFSIFTSINTISFVSSSKQATQKNNARLERQDSILLDYRLNRNVFTVIDFYKKWTVNLEIESSVSSLNDKYENNWRKNWSDSEREFYSKKLAIMKYIKNQTSADNSIAAEMQIIEIKRTRNKMSLNKLANRIRKKLEWW